jgi:hypothetical protein
MAVSLFGYTIVNSSYTSGNAGAIGADSRTESNLNNFSVYRNRITGLNGDPNIYNFLDAASASRVVIGQYDSSSPISFQIWNPVNTTWASVATDRTWNAVTNLYGVAVKDSWLYAVGYDQGNIARVDMANNSYTQSASFNFPTYFNAIEIAAGHLPIIDPTYYQSNGVAVAIVGSYLYGLFTSVDDPWATNPNYYSSTIVRMTINNNGTLSYTAGDYVRVGKNATTLEVQNNHLYVCCIGGKQKAGSANSESRINIVNLATFPAAASVTTPITHSAETPGDFRDISILGSDNVYVLSGYYTANYTNLTGGVYKTTVANLAAGQLGMEVISLNDPGYYWGIHCEDVPGGTDRFWFIKGVPVVVYASLPTSETDTNRSFTAADLGNAATDLVNSATLIQASQSAGARVAKAFGPQAVLAVQARKAASALVGREEEQ